MYDIFDYISNSFRFHTNVYFKVLVGDPKVKSDFLNGRKIHLMLIGKFFLNL